MQTINIHAAKTHLSSLVEKASQGEPFIIAKAGKPMVVVVPYAPSSASGLNRVGFLSGLVNIPSDFDQMESEQIASSFEGVS